MSEIRANYNRLKYVNLCKAKLNQNVHMTEGISLKSHKKHNRKNAKKLIKIFYIFYEIEIKEEISPIGEENNKEYIKNSENQSES